MDVLTELSRFGRAELYTDEPVIDERNVLRIVQEAYAEHISRNLPDTQYLLNYEAGEQPIKREKKFRSDINFQVIDNVASEITEFWLAFAWSAAMRFVQRDGTDAEKDLTEAVSALSAAYDSADITSKRQELGRYVEVTGVGYTYVDINTESEDGEAPFTIDVLDPRFTFVVHSSYYVDHRPMLGVTYRVGEDGVMHFTAFSRDRRYEIRNLITIEGGQKKDQYEHEPRSGEKNPLGRIPIIEWLRSPDRQGVFERYISEMDGLNLMSSNVVNDVEQETSAVWHANDVAFPTKKTTDSDGNVKIEVQHPKSSEWVQTTTTQDGKEPFIKPLTLNYDYEGILEHLRYRRMLILQKAGVPQRNDNSGGSTGIAMSDSTGWTAAEMSAAKRENLMRTAMMEELRLVIKAAKVNPATGSDDRIANLRFSDLDVTVSRRHDYELTVKSNALATLMSHGIDGLDAMRAVNLFDDVAQVYDASKELIDKYQKSIFEPAESTSKPKNEPVGGAGEDAPNASRTMSDYSDQEVNSEMIGGK